MGIIKNMENAINKQAVEFSINKQQKGWGKPRCPGSLAAFEAAPVFKVQ